MASSHPVDPEKQHPATKTSSASSSNNKGVAGDDGMFRLRHHHGSGREEFGDLMAVRWFLGTFRERLFPARDLLPDDVLPERATSEAVGDFLCGAEYWSAFGGLLAFGVFQIQTGDLADWRYLFLVEGGCTFLFAWFALWYLPYSAARCEFLSEEEKKVAFARMQLDSSSEVNEAFKFKEAVKIFKHPTSWIILGIETCLGIPLQSLQLFLPVIVARLGYSTVKTNLYTVAPNISGAIVLLILAFSSDLTRLRFPFVVLGFLLTFTGFIIYASIDVKARLHVAYFACFMMTWGTSAPSVILDVWYNNNNIANENRRVMLTSVSVPVANLMGVVSSNIFQKKDAPKYIPALATTAALGAFGCLLTIILGAWMIINNKRRDRKQGRVIKAIVMPTDLMGDGN
ncbi:uncharacterized protein KY384_004860 [Bacidia gigantensis]|uniref:uncharacterized protein n=1 Tax=Bacidia gigantensis TaxID=2732470 RepID=UPI001D057C6C|nr:uncharacterized protein KY384_004860 [Bacidia gigantensis]KAG8530358.1 hypothetical protein KY384_004860 [Bacidia gigantensis]